MQVLSDNTSIITSNPWLTNIERLVSHISCITPAGMRGYFHVWGTYLHQSLRTCVCPPWLQSHLLQFAQHDCSPPRRRIEIALRVIIFHQNSCWYNPPKLLNCTNLSCPYRIPYFYCIFRKEHLFIFWHLENIY